MCLKFKPPWPYLTIILVTSVYFIYLLNDGRFFAYDDFTALKFVADRSYLKVIIDSLASRSVDRHKFIGYILHKWLYDTVGLRVTVYFFVLYLLHTLNGLLIYKLLDRLSRRRLISLLLAGVFAYRFYLWWWSNSHVYLEAIFGLLFIHLWLSYLRHRQRFFLLCLYLTWPLMVFSYGPAVLLPLALVPLTVYHQGRLVLANLKPLVPFLLLLAVYLPTFIFTADTLERFTSADNPYHPVFNLSTLLTTQSIYFYELSGRLLPQSVVVTVTIWAILVGLCLLTKPRLLLLLASFLLALAANSFFPQHTIFYYLYLPIIFVLILFSQLLQSPFRLVSLLLFLVVFYPAKGLMNVQFRLRHPAPCFECQSLIKINQAVSQAININQSQVQLSNWDVTPNLSHLVDYQVLPLFLTHPDKNDYRYAYSRASQILTILKGK